MKSHVHFQSLPSTNTYLKELVGKYPAEELQNVFPPYFAVTADEQTSGRGQQGKKWESESGKKFIGKFFVVSKHSDK